MFKSVSILVLSHTVSFLCINIGFSEESMKATKGNWAVTFYLSKNNVISKVDNV